MQCTIRGRNYELIPDTAKSTAHRDAYFALAKSVFGLDFTIWYDSGYSTDGFMPYTLFDGDRAVASVGVAITDLNWRGKPVHAAQLSTIMTANDYRGLGLSAWLMKHVLDEWKGKADLIYLHANDSVLDFYPKFGFIRAQEYVYRLPIHNNDADYRKLDLDNEQDAALLMDLYGRCNNPYSALQLVGAPPTFHLVTNHPDNVYYVEKYNAVIVAEVERNELWCYDIYTDSHSPMADILGAVADDMTTVRLGFTPIDDGDCSCEKLLGKHTASFAIDGDYNIFRLDKVTFPLLSQA